MTDYIINHVLTCPDKGSQGKNREREREIETLTNRVPSEVIIQAVANAMEVPNWCNPNFLVLTKRIAAHGRDQNDKCCTLVMS